MRKALFGTVTLFLVILASYPNLVSAAQRKVKSASPFPQERAS